MKFLKKLNFVLVALIVSAMTLLIVSSCDEDEPEPEPFDSTKYIPVIIEDFDTVVNGNTVEFTIESSLTGNVWFVDLTTDKEYQVVDGKVSFDIGTPGTYPFTCNVLVEGVVYTSAVFNIVIVTENVDYLNYGIWKLLTGGANKTKTWRLDMRAGDKNNCLYFAGPLFYSGYASDTERKAEWSYWAWDLTPEQVAQIQAGTLKYPVNSVEQSNIFNWSPDYAGNKWIMPAADYGTINFDGTQLVAKTSKFGVDETGSFSLDTATWKLTLSNVTLPIDTGRVNDGQFKDEDLLNLRIFTISDSAMQIGVKRSFEAGDKSEWVHVYNFICADYTYPEPVVTEGFTFNEAESVKKSFATADLIGTWKYADVIQGWIQFKQNGDQGTIKPPRLFGKWDTRDNVVTDLVSWGASDAATVFTNADAARFVFNNDGTCVINGVNNKFSVSEGVITFTDTLKSEINLVWLNLQGTVLKVIDVQKYGDNADDYTPQGIWIGNKNGSKDEFQAVQLVKQ